jgi:hypothetical protein
MRMTVRNRDRRWTGLQDFQDLQESNLINLENPVILSKGSIFLLTPTEYSLPDL